MIEVRPASADEMILAFVQAEVDSHRYDKLYACALAMISADRVQLIDRADLNDPQQNAARRAVLDFVRGYERNIMLFESFPSDTSWRLVTVTPTEMTLFRYANHPTLLQLSKGTRLISDGVKNLDQVQTGENMREHITGVADRLRRGDRFPALIAVQCVGSPELVLMEGHSRATAYALTGLPEEIHVLIGSSPYMRNWRFF